MKLTEIKGAECLPKETDIKHSVNACETKREAFCLGLDCGINNAINDLQSVQIDCDVEALAEILMNRYDEDCLWEQRGNVVENKRKFWVNEAKIISESISKILVIERKINE